MYNPRHFEETRPKILRNLIQQHPLATVVSLDNGELNANHVPLLFRESSSSFGLLQGHVARANPLLSDISQEHESLIIFQGPNAYITPSWYEEKPLSGKVVPTWNYLAVHVYGTIKSHDDPDWLRAHLKDLTAINESDFATPWQVEDAPEDYINRMMRGIVGIEITINRVVGKWKLSQNKSVSDQQNIIDGLRERTKTSDLAQVMTDRTSTKQ